MDGLIVGGDFVEQLKRTLVDAGCARVEHWAGRKPGDLRRTIPDTTGVVVVLTDYVGHGLVKKVREDAARAGVEVLYVRRSLGEVREKVARWAAQHGMPLRKAG